MSVTVTELGPFERQVTIRYEGASLARAETRAARRLSLRLDINGFRRGKAPRRMVENLVGKDRIRQEAVEELVEQGLPSVLADADLSPAVAPSVEAMRQVGHGVEVDVRVSMWPMLDAPPDYQGRRYQLRDPGIVVDEATITDQIDRYRGHFAELETVERAAATGDFVAIDLHASHGGRSLELISVSDLLFEVGSDSNLEDLNPQLIGSSAGDILSFPTRLRMEDEGLAAGTEIYVRVLVKEVKEKRLPELDDEWVHDFTEFDTVEEFRAGIAEELEQTRSRILSEGLAEQVLFELSDEVRVEIPEAVKLARAAQIHDRMLNALQAADRTFESYLEQMGRDEEAYFNGLQAQALIQIRTRVMLDSVAVDAGFEVTESELEQFYEEAAEGLDETAEELATRLAGSIQEINVMSDILRAKARAAVLRGAVATDSDGNVLDLHLEVENGAEAVEAETEQGDQ